MNRWNLADQGVLRRGLPGEWWLVEAGRYLRVSSGDREMSLRLLRVGCCCRRAGTEGWGACRPRPSRGVLPLRSVGCWAGWGAVHWDGAGGGWVRRRSDHDTQVQREYVNAELPAERAHGGFAPCRRITRHRCCVIRGMSVLTGIWKGVTRVRVQVRTRRSGTGTYRAIACIVRSCTGSFSKRSSGRTPGELTGRCRPELVGQILPGVTTGTSGWDCMVARCRWQVCAGAQDVLSGAHGGGRQKYAFKRSVPRWAV